MQWIPFPKGRIRLIELIDPDKPSAIKYSAIYLDVITTEKMMIKQPNDNILVDHYTVAVGPGGTICIPKDWQEFFVAGKSMKVVLLPAPGPSIWLFAGHEYEALLAIAERAPPDEETERFLAQFGKPCEAVLTSKYALMLSARMRHRLGIRKRAILIGCYDHAEIMSPKAWKTIDTIPSDVLAQAVQELGL